MGHVCTDTLRCRRLVGARGRRVVTEQKAGDGTMRSPPPPPTPPPVSASVGKHMGFLFGCLFVFFKPVAWCLSSEAVMVKAQPSLWGGGNHGTAGDEEAAPQPRHRGLFIRTPPKQHTDEPPDWEQKKPVFDTSLLVPARPGGLGLPRRLISGRAGPVAHLMGLANGRNRAASLQPFHLPPPPPTNP